MLAQLRRLNLSKLHSFLVPRYDRLQRNPSQLCTISTSCPRAGETPISSNTSFSDGQPVRGCVVGCYDNDSETGFELSDKAKDLDRETSGKLSRLMSISGGKVGQGEARLFYDLTPTHTHVALVGVGPPPDKCKPEEETQTDKNNLFQENVRRAVAVGTKMLKDAKVKHISVDDFNHPTASAEGGVLSLFSFNKLKTKTKKSSSPHLACIGKDQSLWLEGCVQASAQNFARELMEMPSNLMTPSLFVEAVQERAELVRQSMSDSAQLQIIPRPLSWIQSQKMGAFLAVTQGSVEVPWLLEMRLNYPIEDTEAKLRGRPIVLVGKGVTFDTGGVSIKPATNMGLMRGDMGGGACVASTLLGLAELNVRRSVVALVPLCENMVSGCAVKPGDVVTAMNGKTIAVDNTDAEGRLILADALSYAHTFQPEAIVDLATLTGAIDIALGGVAAGVFTNSTTLWEGLNEMAERTLHVGRIRPIEGGRKNLEKKRKKKGKPCKKRKASSVAGDYLWRMPLYSQFSKQIESNFADISNVGKRSRSAGACTAAAFLKEFVVEGQPWAHIDIAGVMESHGEVPYLSKGMSGRPTRTLMKFVQHYNQSSVNLLITK